MTNNDDAPSGELVIYSGKDGRLRVQAQLRDETLWLTQRQMAELFGVDVRTISEHLKNIFQANELSEDATIRNFRIVQQEGTREVSRAVAFYHLDAVIAVGYRVNSVQATHFRIWATQVLREYIIKGFALDDERLKNPSVAGAAVPDYFDEMLERIRDIRASERRMYLRVRDIFALAADYQPSLPETRQFFQTIQNKLHHAVTGMTAPEIIANRINHLLPNAGLTTWKGKEVQKTDITTAKNYLHEKEIRELNRFIAMWLDYAEDQAERRKQIFMRDWERKLDEFIRFHEREVLSGAGKRTRKDADAIAAAEFEKFAQRRRKEKEDAGAVENIRALESVAKRLESSTPKRARQKKGE